MSINRDILKEQLVLGLTAGDADDDHLSVEHVADAVISFYELNVMVQPLLTINVAAKQVTIDDLTAHVSGFFKYSYGKYKYQMTLMFSPDYTLCDVVALKIGNETIVSGPGSV